MERLTETFPAMIAYKDGTWHILAQVAKVEEEVQYQIIELKNGRFERVSLTMEELIQNWSGNLLLLKKTYALDDENQPFGLRWFIPRIIKQKKLFRDIAIASITLTFLGLATPIFFQLVIDKVLVHESYSTFYVLGIGIVFVILFDGLFGFLRRYILLYASNRIDINLATHTFKHLTNIPVTFLKKHLAGFWLNICSKLKRFVSFLLVNCF